MSLTIKDILSVKEDTKAGVVFAYMVVADADNKVRKVREIFDLASWGTISASKSYTV